MPCYHPTIAYRGKKTNPETGKRPLSFNPREGYIDLPVKIPCGGCLGCRLEKARQWRLRMMHEAELHEDNSFITLTYAPENLPPGGTLVKRDLQLFMKRLRKRFGEGIKFYGVGEYGSLLKRPHYHVILFGHDFQDKTLWFAGKSRKENLYRSKDLEKLWTVGFTTVGSVTVDSCGYVARYVTKKITGKMAEKHYQGKQPEFALMSRGGKNGRGLAYDWFKKYSTDVYPKDFVTLKGTKQRPPAYYDKLYEQFMPEAYQEVKLSRLRWAEENEVTPRRLQQKEKYAESMARRNLKRKLEEGDK